MEVLVLGPLEVRLDGRRLDLGPPKQRAVLALLAVHAGTVVPVDTLVDHLWDGRPPRSAEAGLQTYVSNLRRLLEPERGPRAEAEVIVTRPPGYLLPPDAVRLDAHQFVQLAGQGRAALAAGDHTAAADLLHRALDLWRGPAYADVRDAPAVAPEAARLEQLRLATMEDHAEARLHAGDAAGVAADLEPFVGEHPLRERAWRLLALALQRCDRQAEALDALRRARRHLQDQLGIDPGAALQELELAILRQDPPAPPPERRRQVDQRQVDQRQVDQRQVDQRPLDQRPIPAGPFVGRVEELATLHRIAAAGRGVALVEGEPGVGKTRLVEQFVATGGVPAVWGRCPEHEAAPALWPWEGALRALTARRPGVPLPPALAPLLAGTPGGPQGQDLQDAAGAQLRLYEAVTGYLAAAAPVVVVIDDLQWADSASQRLLVHVALAAPAGVLVVATFRRHEASALTATLAALTRAGAARIGLDGLSEPDVRELAAAVRGGDPGAVAARGLYERTRGNPLFVTLASQGDGTAASTTPTALRDVVLQRVAGLPAGAADLLRTAAVAGDEVEIAVLVDVAGRPADGVLDDLDDAVAAGLLSDDTGALGTYRFTHALVREALDGHHSRLRRARIHRRYAEAVERLHGRDDERAGALARHWLAAAELDPECARAAVRASARAARSAMRRLAPEDAVRSWQESLAAQRLAGDDPDATFAALLGLVEAHYAAGQTGEGLGLLDDVLDATGNDPARVTAAAIAVLGQSSWYPFDYGVVPTRLIAALAAAVEALPARSADRALALGCLGALQCHAGLTDESPVTSAAAVASARAADGAGPDLLVRVLFLRLLALHGCDHAEQALDTARDLLAQPAAPPALAATARIMELSALLMLGRIEEAAPLEQRLPATIEAARSPALTVQGAFVQAALLAFRGRLDEAEALAEATYAPLAPLGLGSVLSTRTTQMFDRALQGGHLAVLDTDLADVRRRTRIDGYGAALALALLAQGRRDEARTVFDGVPLPPRDYTWIGTVIGLLLAAAELADLGRVTQLRELLLPFRDRLGVQGTCTAVTGAVAQYLGEAALVLGDVDTARRDLTHALDLLERAHAPLWAARARATLARCSDPPRSGHPAGAE